MKLYSRGQVIFYSLISASAVLLILAGFRAGIGIYEKFTSENSSSTQTTAAAPQDNNGFEYQAGYTTEKLNNVNQDFNKNNYGSDELENINIYQKYNEAVVNISIEVVTFNWFLEPMPQQGGSGSGVIIDKRGYILTNKHVVENAYKVYVTLADGTQYEGAVLGVDPENDLSVIKIEAGDKNLVTIPMGYSENLLVGQKVLAIGNPFGYERTLTVGVISGLGRPVKPSTRSSYIIKDMIQTDTSINPGNSGGPLISSRGELIGINTMIYSPSGGSVGIGFAVPIDTARRVVPDIINYGEVRRGWIEIEPVQLFPELVRFASLPVSKGILVSRVVSGSNAEKAGIRGGKEPVRYGRSTIFIGGDIITEVDGTPVKSLADLYSALEDNKPEDTVSVRIIRDRKEMELQVTLSERNIR